MSNKLMQSRNKVARRTQKREAVADHLRAQKAKLMTIEVFALSFVLWLVFSLAAFITGQRGPLITDHPDGKAFTFHFYLQLCMMLVFIYPMVRGLVVMVFRLTKK